MADIMIKVSTDAMVAKANVVRSLCAQMKREYDNFFNLANRTASYWIGDGADRIRKDFQKEESVTRQMLQRLEIYPTNLEEMAGIYVDAEKQNTGYSTPLSGNVIV